MTTAVEIIKTLFPYLKAGALYAEFIQDRVVRQPQKEHLGNNPFALALSDADIGVQHAVEVAVLAHYPEVRFYGEEYESSLNTKYMNTIFSFSEAEILVTLDPIDGTRAYLDGLDGYSLVLGVSKGKMLESVISLYPKLNCFIYAEMGKGAFKGILSEGFDSAVKMDNPCSSSTTVLVASGLSLRYFQEYDSPWDFISIHDEYDAGRPINIFYEMWKGEYAAVVVEKSQLIDSYALGFIAGELGGFICGVDGIEHKDISVFSDPTKGPPMVFALNEEVGTSVAQVFSYHFEKSEI